MKVNAVFRKAIVPTVTNCKLLQEICERWFNQTIVSHNLDLFVHINSCTKWAIDTDSMGLPIMATVYKDNEVVTIIGVRS